MADVGENIVPNQAKTTSRIEEIEDEDVPSQETLAPAEQSTILPDILTETLEMLLMFLQPLRMSESRLNHLLSLDEPNPLTGHYLRFMTLQ